MISVVVRDYANAATHALYEGAEKLEILDRLPRIIRTPLYGITLPIVAAADVFIETVTPLFQTIESVVFYDLKRYFYNLLLST